MLKKVTSSPTWKIFRRILPTLLGLYIIGTFLQTNPKLATQFEQQILTRFGVNIPQPSSQFPDLIQGINNYRQKNQKTTLSHNQVLDSLANVLALSMAQDKNQQPQITLKQAASIVDYQYSVISYFALVSPQTGPFFSLDNWLSDNKKDLLSSEFSQIGIRTLTINIDSASDFLTVIVLAKPASTTVQNEKVSGATTASSNNNDYYTGTQLWSEIQKYRREHGVPEYKQDNTLCTISSIRLNQLLNLGKLDNHTGFEPLIDQYRKENRISYTNVGENILMGYNTPQEAVAAWDGSPGHQALLRDGAYTFACTSANHGFAVLIAAF